MMAATTSISTSVKARRVLDGRAALSTSAQVGVGNSAVEEAISREPRATDPAHMPGGAAAKTLQPRASAKDRKAAVSLNQIHATRAVSVPSQRLQVTALVGLLTSELGEPGLLADSRPTTQRVD